MFYKPLTPLHTGKCHFHSVTMNEGFCQQIPSEDTSGELRIEELVFQRQTRQKFCRARLSMSAVYPFCLLPHLPVLFSLTAWFLVSFQ